MIVIVNYGVGNVSSILNMLKKIGVEGRLSESPHDLLNADKIILPGVGSFDYGMRKLKETGYLEAILEFAQNARKPILGICLGMQMLGKSSEEGVEQGLNLIPFKNVKFGFKDSNLKIPHMGWNLVWPESKLDPLTKQFDEEFRFYFVHSYYAECENSENVLLKCDYGFEFVAGVKSGNIYGVQFHPEKSHYFGMQLLKNFADLPNV